MPRHILPERSQERWRFVPFIPVKSTGHASMKSSHTPTIKLFCPSEACSGSRHFSPVDDDVFLEKHEPRFEFITYQCRNCKGSVKRYAIRVLLREDAINAEMYKFGETPPF